MIPLLDLVWLILAGLGGGIIAGMLGIGGGVIYVIVFTTYLNYLAPGDVPGDVLVKMTIANSVFALIFAGLSGCLKQYRIQNFYPRLVLLIGIPAAINGIFITILLEQVLYTRFDFTVVFIVLLIPIILRMLYKKKRNEHSPTEFKRWIFSILGLTSGAATAISGLGGGFIIVPVLNGLLRIPIKKTVSLSLGVIATVALGISTYNLIVPDFSQYNFPYTIGAITFPMVLPTIAGVLTGAPIGVTLSQQIKSYHLRIFFVTFCILVIIKMLYDII